MLIRFCHWRRFGCIQTINISNQRDERIAIKSCIALTHYRGLCYHSRGSICHCGHKTKIDECRVTVPRWASMNGTSRCQWDCAHECKTECTTLFKMRIGNSERMNASSADSAAAPHNLSILGYELAASQNLADDDVVSAVNRHLTAVLWHTCVSIQLSPPPLSYCQYRFYVTGHTCKSCVIHISDRFYIFGHLRLVLVR